MSNNRALLKIHIFLSFSFQQPHLIFHSSSWTAERSSARHWIKARCWEHSIAWLVQNNHEFHRTSACVAQTLLLIIMALILFIWSSINLTQDLFHLFLTFCAYLLKTKESEGFFHIYRSVSEIFFKTQLAVTVDMEIVQNRSCIRTSFLSNSCHDLQN